MSDLLLETARLSLLAASVEELQTFINGDAAAFTALTGVTAPDPFVAPPETDDVMAWFRDAIAADQSIRPWFFRWVIDRQRNVLVGSTGFGGSPDKDGYVITGYSTYPAEEGRGYAGEAAAALAAWALRQPGVRKVRATIFPSNLASKRVATKAGLRYVKLMNTDDGEIELWESVGLGLSESANDSLE
jgi:ribosomal-protein-alanine N-acetyltransferase